MQYMIVSSLCIMAIAVNSWEVFFTSSPINIRPNTVCTPIPTYRISNSSATVQGETAYQIVSK